MFFVVLVVLVVLVGLRRGQRISHGLRNGPASLFEAAAHHRCSHQYRPGLMEKASIIQTAVDLARLLSIERPKVAALSAVEVMKADTHHAAITLRSACGATDRCGAGVIMHNLRR